MRVEIYMNETSQPVVFEQVVNTYTKGPMFCVYLIKDLVRIVQKFPAQNIFRVIEINGR